MSAVLDLIAHAASSATRKAVFLVDEPVDGAGAAKAAALAGRIRRVDAAWCSPALRARQTAAALGLDAVVEPALRDVGLGRWAGRTLDEVAAAEPDAAAAWLADPAAAPHGGESVIELMARLRPWLDVLGHRDGRFIGVTHAAIMRAALVLTLDAAVRSFWRIDVGPLARLRLRGARGQWTLVGLGRLEAGG